MSQTWHWAAAVMGAVVLSSPASAGGAIPIALNNQAGTVGLVATHTPDSPAIPYLHEWMTGGMGVGDFNRDGAPDLYWISGGGMPDKLFINNGAGSFTDEAAAWGLGELHCGSGASVGDYDGDGFPDIYVTSFGQAGNIGPGHNRLYRNNGNGSFTDVAAAAGVEFTSPTVSNGYGSAFGDYDLDGDLDLFVTTHTTQGGASPESDGNRLYRNNGDGTFTDFTEASGIAAAVDGVRAFQPAFADMNGDLYPELLIAADFATIRYVLNHGDGTFTDVTGQSGTGVDDNGMGQTVADIDNDGVLDWYVTSVHLEYEYSPVTPGTGNMLYVGQGSHLFLEESIDRGVNDGGWGWGTVAVDLDHDGWQELVEVNGWPGDVEFQGERAKLFYNDGTGGFSEAATGAGFDSTHDGRSVVYLDGDLDGDLDIAVGNYLGPLEYYRNDSPAGNWLHVVFDTSNNGLLAPDGFGTLVTATAGGVSQVRYMDSSPSFLATSEQAVHFGLGAAATVDELRIGWARGQVTVMTDVAANQRLTITSPRLGDIDADGTIGINDFLFLIGNWGPVTGPANMAADFDADGMIGITEFLYVLGNWG